MDIHQPIHHSKQQFPALTGVRALGAMAVFFIHLPFDMGHRILVDVMAFFFVLSGFLIVYLYFENDAIRAGKLDQYFVNRFARIFPVYFLLVTIAILLRQDFRPVFLFKNYTLTHAFFNNIRDRAIQPSWSITVEECFYLLAPIIMYLIRRFNYLVALLFGASLLGMALLISILPISFLHKPHFVFTITFFGHFFEFFCGIFLALLILKKKTQPFSLTGKNYTITGSIGILAAISILLISNNMNDPNRASQFIFINNFILPLPITLFYYGLIREKSRTSYILSTPLLQILGRTSYAFYLVHMIVIESIAAPFIEIHFQNHHNLYVLLVFVLTQCIAFFIFRFYEEPFNLFIRAKFINAGNKKNFLIKRFC